MSKLQQQSDKPTFEKVWLMFQELGKKFQDTDKKFQDTDKKFQDTDKKFQDTDKKFQETDEIIRKLSKKMSESESRWAKFVESLVEGILINLLNEKGIRVEKTFMRAKQFYDNRQYEIDIIAINGNELVAVEVKTTLSVDDVNDFIEDMKVFSSVFPEYSDKKHYGAVAFIDADSKADVMVERKGFFVIKATSESTRIMNKPGFKPKAW